MNTKDLIQMIIERLRKKPEDFTWVPSLSHKPLKRDEISYIARKRFHF